MIIEESLARFQQVGDSGQVAWALFNLGSVLYRQQNYDRATKLCHAMLDLLIALNQRGGIPQALYGLGNVALAQGKYAQAQEFHQKRLDNEQELGNEEGVVTSLYSLAQCAVLLGDAEHAMLLLDEMLIRCRKMTSGTALLLGQGTCELGYVALMSSQHQEARERFVEALELWSIQRSLTRTAYLLEGFAWLTAARGRAVAAARLLGAAETLRGRRRTGYYPEDGYYRERIIALAQARLDSDVFAMEWQVGQALTMEQAIAYALDVSA